MAEGNFWGFVKAVLLYGGVAGFLFKPWETAIALISICLLTLVIWTVLLVVEAIDKELK